MHFKLQNSNDDPEWSDDAVLKIEINETLEKGGILPLKFHSISSVKSQVKCKLIDVAKK